MFVFIKLICVLLIIIVLGIFFIYSKKDLQREKAILKKIVIYNLKQIEKTTDWLSDEDFNYINNEYYQNIQNLKAPVIPILMEIINDSKTNGLQKYLCTLVISRLANCNSTSTSTNYIKDNNFLEITKGKCYFLKTKNTFTNKMVFNFNKYPDFFHILHESNIKIPQEEEIVPQGITLVNNFIFITAYHEKNFKSICYVLSKYGQIINKVELDNSSHVGGIQYDQDNKLLWIPAENGMLNAYTVKDFFTNQQVQAKYQFTGLSNNLVDYQNKSQNTIDYLTIHDKYLYIGNFSKNQTGIIKKFQIVKTKKNINLKFLKSFEVPSQVQGITFYQNNNQIYLLLSISYGRNNSSYLHIYKYDEKITNYSNPNLFKLTYELPPLLEQITIKEKWLYALFESNAPKYSNCQNIINHIPVFDMNFLLKEFKN